MKSSIKLYALLATILLTGCSKVTDNISASKNYDSIDLYSGDVHDIIKTDGFPNALIERYLIFSAAMFLRDVAAGPQTTSRDIYAMKGMSQIMDKRIREFTTEKDRKAFAQKAFNAFAKAHGKVLSEEEDSWASESSWDSDVTQVTYKFQEENGFRPDLTFQWHKTTFPDGGETVFYLEILEQHIQYPGM